MNFPEMKNKISAAWAFPCCTCVIIILFLLLSGVAAGTLIGHLIGEENSTEGGFSGNCATIQEKEIDGKNYKIPDGGSGGISHESHLRTLDEQYDGKSGFPTNQKDKIQNHLNITNFSKNCPGCSSSSQVWTPPEGGGLTGQGKGSLPSASIEPWVMNMRWTKMPPAGTKVIITATKTGKSVVTAAGYELGPGASSGNIAGTQIEALNALGIDHGDDVMIGFAEDQTVPYGPITCGAGSNGEILANPDASGYVCPLITPGVRVSDGYNTCHRTGRCADLNKGSGEDDFGAPIVAIRGGRVIYVWDGCNNHAGKWQCTNWGMPRIHGNAVKILQDDGSTTNYGHIKQFSARQSGIQVGTIVNTGQKIAEVDDVGNSSASHLHIQINNRTGVRNFMRQLCR